MRTIRSIRSARTARTAGTSRSSRALALSTASVAGAAVLVASGYAQAAEPARTPAPASSPTAASTADPSSTNPVRVEHQVGKVLEGTALVGEAGTTVMATIYENSMYGSSLQVVLGDPDEDHIGYVEQAAPFFEGGAIDVTIDVDGTPVRFQGTATEAGRPTKITEPIQDNGEQIVTRGTNTQLATDITVTVGGVSAPVEFAPAFAFDLVSRKVTLYGR